MTTKKIVVVIVAVGLLGIGYGLLKSQDDLEHAPLHEGPSAAIVDQLSLTVPNPGFIQQSSRLLLGHGFIVDYYPGEQVTVDFYRNLPSFGYDILILRTHATAENLVMGETGTTLFTGEEYSFTRHTKDQATARVSMVGYSPGEYGGDMGTYFGISPAFLKNLNGGFNDALVLMMGCQGMVNDVLAQTFLDQGAGAYVGWDDEVSAYRTDSAMLWWLQSYLDGASLEEATIDTMDAVGFDDEHGSKLHYMDRNHQHHGKDGPSGDPPES